MSKIWKAFVILGATIGLFLIGLSFYYLCLYISEPDNSYRHEYLAGIAMAIMFSVPLWLLTSYSMYRIRKYRNRNTVPKIIYISTVIITVIVCLLFLAGLASPLYLDK